MGWSLIGISTVLLAGCQGGPSIDPQLEARQRELSKQTISTAELPARQQPMAGSGAYEDEAPEDGTGETPAPMDDPQPGEPAPPPDPDMEMEEEGPYYGDDSVRCGNGIVDPNEYCDITIPEGEEGACPSECDDSDPCFPEKLQVRGCWTMCVAMEPTDPSACE